MKRFTVTDLVRESGLCPDTIRKYADTGKIPVKRDANNWRVFNKGSSEAAKKLAGVDEGSEVER
jgi:DNA-binding transcriptional MerR regulator